MRSNPPTFTGRLRSVQFALRGLATLLQTQPNARLHAVATVLVVGFGLTVGLTLSEWCWIVLAITAVWTTEALNTAIEFLTDLASPTFHPLAEKVKDLAAGAVLLAALGSVIIGGLVLGPYVVGFLR